MWSAYLYVAVTPSGPESHVFMTFSGEFSYGVEALAEAIAKALKHPPVQGEATVVLCIPSGTLTAVEAEIVVVEWEAGLVK